jgi:DNA ligase (NAD+)
VSRPAFDIVGLGPKILEQLVEAGLIKNPADLFTLTEGDLAPLERFAETKAKNIIEAIAARKTLPLDRFINALGIRNVGEETARDLAEELSQIAKSKVKSQKSKVQFKMQNFNELFLEITSGLKKEDWQGVRDIGPVVAKNLTDYFQSERNKAFLQKLFDVGIRIVVPKFKIQDSRFQGKTFVLTGELASMTRDVAKQKIRVLGGNVSESVSIKTAYVVIGDNPGSKFANAQRLGVATISEQQFFDLLS